MSQSKSPDSRLSKTNRADPPEAEYGPSARQTQNVQFSTESGHDLRTDVADPNRAGSQTLRTGEAVSMWRRYVEDSRDTQIVLANPDGEMIQVDTMNRFDPEYGDKQYAKLKDLERGIKGEYGKRLYTAMLTLTASPYRDGELIGPVDHLDELLSSWEAVRRALDRCIGEKRYERLAILEPHKSGYIHVHIAVFVDGLVTESAFEDVMDAHVRNCGLAEKEAHTGEEGAISVNYAGGNRDGDGIEELAIYLSEYLNAYGDPLDDPDHAQIAHTTMWATETQRWRPSNGAQEYMAADDRESTSDWELLGIEDDDGELHEVESGGTTSTFTTWMPGDPPPVD